jgi:S-DNA-T family DNA segregation ATPase FtsK/SpoIIIE
MRTRDDIPATWHQRGERPRPRREVADIARQYRPLAVPVIWMIAAEAITAVLWLLPSFLGAVAIIVACLAVGLRIAVRNRNKPVPVRQYATVSWAAGSLWSLVATLAGPFVLLRLPVLFPLPVLQLILLAGGPILSAGYWYGHRAPAPSGRRTLAGRLSTPAGADSAPASGGEADVVAPVTATAHAATAFAAAAAAAPAGVPAPPSAPPASPVVLRASAGTPAPAPEPRYTLPPVGLLSQAAVSRAGAQAKAITLMKVTLAEVLSEHKVDATVVGHVTGPTVTLYKIKLGPGVKAEKVTQLRNTLAVFAGTPDVRMLIPVPGEQLIGIELPNRAREPVTLASLMAALDTHERAKHPLTVALGASTGGGPVITCLADQPHVLIAGTTGSGKTTAALAILTQILLRATPDEVRFLLIDPKRVEFTRFAGVPHLLFKVITDARRAAAALEWTTGEIDRRYTDMEVTGFRHIDDFNKAVRAGEVTARPCDLIPGDERTAFTTYPYLLVAVDELSDLMQFAPREVEDAIVRIAQIGRAAGVHLLLATQYPNADVVTPLIKQNVPCRWAFAVADNTASRVILDQVGAEALIGLGDSLWKPKDTNRPDRVQGVFVSEDELKKIIAAAVTQAGLYAGPRADLPAAPPARRPPPAAEAAEPDDGEVTAADLTQLLKCAEHVIRSQFGSTSMLQRKERIGFAKAGRMMDLLEDAEIVGPSEGSKARNVLVPADDLDQALAALRAKYGDSQHDQAPALAGTGSE